MWLQQEIDELKNYYNKIKDVSIDQIVDEQEMEAIAESAVFNLANKVVAPRKLHKFMTCIRLQYLCIDK